MKIKQEKTIVNMKLRTELLDKTHLDEEKEAKAKLDLKLSKEEDMLTKTDEV